MKPVGGRDCNDTSGCGSLIWRVIPSSHFRNNDDQPPRYHAQLSRAQSAKRITKNGLVVDELTDLASQLATPSAAAAQAVLQVSRSVSIESRGSRVVPLLERRDSVAKMAWDGLSSIVHRRVAKEAKKYGFVAVEMLELPSFVMISEKNFRGTFGTSARRQATSPAATTRGRSPSSSFSPFSVQPTASQMTTVHEVDEENLRVAAETARESFEDATKERREEHPVGHVYLFSKEEFKVLALLSGVFGCVLEYVLFLRLIRCRLLGLCVAMYVHLQMP
uniref:Uncharacterized protein n=1 Tax=Parascaris equorum TaxID=6256 RepID=A0A914RX02_PAREQ